MPLSYISRNAFLNSLLTFCFICISSVCIAEENLPSIDERYIEVNVVDPVRDAGYVVGDILNRKVTLTIKKPYQLVKESLPIVGYEHRYKGQISGIELVKIDVISSGSSDQETYRLDLNYQVFKTDRVAKPAALRAEIFKLRNTKNKEIVQYRLPAFNFRISPLSLIGQIKLDQELYPFIQPLTIDNSKVKVYVKILAVILSLALLGLLYIFGSHAWLPRMGAPFARAYRDIKKMPENADGIKEAISRVHTSLNNTAGNTLFINTLDTFLAEKPAFRPAKKEIEAFFGLSHQIFFKDASHKMDNINQKSWLLTFCRLMRDCERGLTPDIKRDDV